jgi:protein TonB
MGRRSKGVSFGVVMLSVALHAAGLYAGWRGLRWALTSAKDDLVVSGISVTLVEARFPEPVRVEAARGSVERIAVPEPGLERRDFLVESLRDRSVEGVPPVRVEDSVISPRAMAVDRARDDARRWAEEPSYVPDIPDVAGALPLAMPVESVPGVAGVETEGREGADLEGDSGLAFSADVRPRYPAGARARGVEGSVTVAVEVGDSGRVVFVAVTQSSTHPELDQAALDAVRRARFVSKRNGKPAGGKAVLTFRFQLTD